MSSSLPEITLLLGEWRKGDQAALDLLTRAVQVELRQIAQRALRRQPRGQTLQTADLVNEAYLRLLGQANVDWQNRAHFFAVAARVMRFVLVDHARARQMAKRSSGEQVSLDEIVTVTPDKTEGRVDDLLALNDALERLATFDEQKSRIVEMRYFAGMSVDEVAEALGISGITVKREWARARAWLYRELGGTAETDE
ncbi:MAG TPA: sigma-70 family RNA polymerase sigma factor [Blastocatellia bacterium]|nr:sigma-70 family RNA polymerase sigma factor [Blastocatellia bacterium]HMX30502.1 sigma-70 family RNA polymerase sigma factor [Blastocatellia bacterium]HMY72981.1 sigma-70 family RNA polymerase sigma factor [Blastocatellia bacterium]HMZ17841.1 sigma-70 family RNA polymerase sigma factor [Blastocatellia bacterium]HNG29701.1 sigma-70 family RNA polymerase sigma factor [Blastocatellia bacterium]